MSKLPRILIAGMGNVLRQDDGYGVEVARLLQQDQSLPANVSVIEVGTGGISLVQELVPPNGDARRCYYDVLILIDATERQGKPGQVFILHAEVPDLDTFPEHVRRDFLADMHYAVPSRALILAKALNVLPPQSYIIGCQPEVYDDFAIGLSDVVSKAVIATVKKVKQFVTEINEKAQHNLQT